MPINVTLDATTGQFNGYAWSENLGWIHLSNADPAYGVAVLTGGAVSLTSSLNPSTVGQSVTFTATVAGTPTPTGTVNFTADGTPITDCTAKALTSGATTCATAGLTVGNRAIAAAYSGDSNYLTSTGNLTQTVNDSAVNGVCGSAHGGIFTSAPTANLCNTGTASTITPSAGTFDWSCAGSNGGTPASCSATHAYTVTPAAGANGSLSPSTAQTVAYNQTTAFTVTPATGYQIDTVTGCNGNLAGTTYTTGAITADCTVSASFRFTTVTPTVTLSANPSAPAVNQATTITATVTAPSGTTSVPSGTVAISGGGQSCTATLSAGTGNCALRNSDFLTCA